MHGSNVSLNGSGFDIVHRAIADMYEAWDMPSMIKLAMQLDCPLLLSELRPVEHAQT